MIPTLQRLLAALATLLVLNVLNCSPAFSQLPAGGSSSNLLQMFQSLTPDQQSLFNGGPPSEPTIKDQNQAANIARPCSGSTAIDWSMEQISRSVQPTDAQRDDLANVKQSFNEAANDLDAHCPTSAPASALGRLETTEARLDAAWRAVLSMQVTLANFETKLSDAQKDRFDQMNFAAQ